MNCSNKYGKKHGNSEHKFIIVACCIKIKMWNNWNNYLIIIIIWSLLGWLLTLQNFPSSAFPNYDGFFHLIFMWNEKFYFILTCGLTQSATGNNATPSLSTEIMPSLLHAWAHIPHTRIYWNCNNCKYIVSSGIFLFNLRINYIP